MLWIIDGTNSYECTACNVHLKGDDYELWIERSNGKTLKLRSGSADEVTLVKDAIDYAIEHGEKALRLS